MRHCGINASEYPETLASTRLGGDILTIHEVDDHFCPQRRLDAEGHQARKSTSFSDHVSSGRCIVPSRYRLCLYLLHTDITYSIGNYERYLTG
jgi:hypothetical protein